MTDLLLDVVDEAAVVEGQTEQLRLQIPMRPVARGNCVRQRGPHRNLDPLDRIHDEQPQLPVEHVAVQNLIERDAAFEVVPVRPGAVYLKWQRVAGEAIIADVRQIVDCISRVVHRQAASDQQSELGGYAQRGFVERDARQGRHQGMKNPPICASLRGGAGALTRT